MLKLLELFLWDFLHYLSAVQRTRYRVLGLLPIAVCFEDFGHDNVLRTCQNIGIPNTRAGAYIAKGHCHCRSRAVCSGGGRGCEVGVVAHGSYAERRGNFDSSVFG